MVLGISSVILTQPCGHTSLSPLSGAAASTPDRKGQLPAGLHVRWRVGGRGGSSSRSDAQFSCTLCGVLPPAAWLWLVLGNNWSIITAWRPPAWIPRAAVQSSGGAEEPAWPTCVRLTHVPVPRPQWHSRSPWFRPALQVSSQTQA